MRNYGINTGSRGKRVLAQGETSPKGVLYGVVKDLEGGSTITYNDRGGDQKQFTQTLRDGEYEFGRMEKIECTSGSVMIYKF